MTNISCTNFRGGILGQMLPVKKEEQVSLICNLKKSVSFIWEKKCLCHLKLQGKMSNTYFQVNINGSI